MYENSLNLLNDNQVDEISKGDKNGNKWSQKNC